MAREVDHPGVFAFEGVRPAYGDGSYTITYDPSRSLLTNTVAVQRFRVSFDITPQPVRYLVLGLAKRVGEPGAVEYVYSDDERLETFVQKVDYLDADGTTPRQTTITYDEAFLAVTNRTFSNGNEQQMASPYALTKMAFRLVKPGAYRVGRESIASGGNDVTFTKPYFISVFKLTHGQYGCMRYGDWRRRDSEVNGNPSEQRKNRALYLDDLRGQHGDAAGSSTVTRSARQALSAGRARNTALASTSRRRRSGRSPAAPGRSASTATRIRRWPTRISSSASRVPGC